MKKWLMNAAAGLCFLLGIVFAVVPGPSVIFFLIGLTLLAFHYPFARKYLKICQNTLTRGCQLLDKKLAKK
ncbi:PGPGW domain-containing protein [Pseudoalteromonas sp. SSDWG2]|uniref:PGPGW domain-containing protein n=1 Tax=Pseudoalteromonas sp. SSDWG2 TaxID=3139391 RepID=UPI003BAAE47D